MEVLELKAVQEEGVEPKPRKNVTGRRGRNTNTPTPTRPRGKGHRTLLPQHVGYGWKQTALCPVHGKNKPPWRVQHC